MGTGLKHLYMTVFLSSIANNMVFPAIPDVTMAALCPGEDECALAIYLSAFQQSIIGVSTVMMIPLIGKLSDIYGRKALLNFPLTLSIIPLVILAFGRTKSFFYAYFVLRTLTAMLTDGSLLCLVLAYVVDVSSVERRATGFGMVMGIICASFIGSTFLTRFLSTNMLFQVATIVAIIALIYMHVFVKESSVLIGNGHLEQPIIKDVDAKEECTLSDEESSSETHDFKKISPLKNFMCLIKRSRTFLFIVVVTFFSVVSKSAMEGSSSMARLHYGKDEYANMMIILGISGIMSQMVFMPVLIPIFGEYKLLSFSLFAGFIAMLIDSIAWAQWVPYVVSMFSIFHLMEIPCLRSIVSKQFGPKEQGMAQGCISSITSLGNIISPLIFSPLTDLFLSDKAPFYYPGFSFLCMGIGMIIAFIPSLLIRSDAVVVRDNNVDVSSVDIEP